MKTKPMTLKKDSADVNKTTTTLSASKCPVCKEVGGKSCQGCHIVSYCSADHQRQHWETHKPNCCPFSLKENESLGRYLVASRKLPPGLFFIEESPLISGPRTENVLAIQNNAENSGPICLSCYKKIRSYGSSSYCLCVKCKWPVCSVACAKAKQHAENECTHFAKNKIKYNPSILPANILCRGIILLRGLLKKPQSAEKDNASSKWSTLMYLQHERVDKSDVFNLNPDIILKLKTYFKVPKLASDEEWNRVNRLIEVNAFSIERVEEENDEPSHATLLFHKSSLIAHACTPNCTWSVGYSPNFSMRVRTSKEIRKGEILTVSYNQPWNYYGTHRRTNIILETGGFVCKCDRCTDPTELGTFSSGIKCKSGNCPGYLLPGKNSMWRCVQTGCQNSLPGIVANSKVESLENELSELQTIYMTVPMAGMKLFEDFIENNRDKVLHKNHWILQQARRIIINSHGSQLLCIQWDQLERFISHCSELLAIWDQLAPGISLERGLYQMHLSRALYLQFEIKSEKLSTRCKTEKFTYLKKIHELQSKALLYWKHDIQTKPLNEDMGYEANILKMEITNTLTQIDALA